MSNYALLFPFIAVFFAVIVGRSITLFLDRYIRQDAEIGSIPG